MFEASSAVTNHLGRRNFFKILGSCLALVGIRDSVHAEDSCVSNIKENPELIHLSSQQLSFLISGNFYENDKNLALLLDFSFTKLDKEVIQKVVLTNSVNSVLATRYFQNSSVNKTYLVFENLDFPSDRMDIFVQTRVLTQVRIYRGSFTSEQLSEPKVKDLRLPAKIQSDLSSSGLELPITSPVFYPAEHVLEMFCQQFPPDQNNQLSTNCPKRMETRWDLESVDDKNNFLLKVSFNQSDLSPERYLRYFILTDPVGRIVGIHKRSYGEHSPGFIYIRPLSPLDQAQWNITPDRSASFFTCPYLLLFVEHVGLTFVQRTIYLR